MAGYIRQDVTNNIADGNVINASDFDNEYNALEAAFHAATGHTHDGTAAEGAPITKIGPTQDVVASASALTPKTDNTVDLGSASFEFKDLYIDGTANIDSLVADTADINAGTIDGVTIGGASAGVGTFTTMNATTVDTTNIEVTTLKAKDGTAAGSIANSTGVVTLASSILTTTDINGGSIDGTAIGAASASTGAFTSLSASGTTTLSGLTASTALALNASKEVVSVTNTGTGNNVLATSPTLTTPVLGAATATSINKVAITAPATSATLTIANGKTLTANNSLTLSGTDATTMTFPSTSATIARTDAAQTFTGTQTVQAAATQDAVALAGRAGGTSSYVSTLTPTTLSASRTVTLPDADTTVPVATQVLTFTGPTTGRTITLPDANFTVARSDAAQSFTGTQTFLSNPVLDAGTANGVLFLDGSKVVTSGSALTFDGTTLGLNVSGGGIINNVTQNLFLQAPVAGGAGFIFRDISAGSFAEYMRLTSTGLGIGTNNPAYKLDVQTSAGRFQVQNYGAGSVLLYSNGALAYNAATTRHEWQVAGSTLMQLESSGNLGLGVTPSASTLATFESEYGLISGKDEVNIIQSAYYGSGGFRYSKTEAAGRYLINSGIHSWFTAPSGTAGDAISFTQALTLDANRNLALNTTSVGTSAVGVLSVGSGTEPSSGPADTVQIYSVDRSAGNTIPAIYCEGSGVTNAGITNVTVTHKIAIKVNGTVYYLLATTDAT